MRRTVLVAIGGNSLMRPGEPAAVATERTHVAETCQVLAAIVAAGWRLAVTHGNGPQVGAALRRSELGAVEAYPLALDLCVASTQGEIGALLQQGLSEALARQRIRQTIATIVSQVLVASNDPALKAPSKPVGPYYSRAEAEVRRRAGWTVVEEPPHGYRRVVPSPEPLGIIEEPAIRALVDTGVVVIALGGGGIPVVQDDGRLESVDAVVDKDLASAVLASHLRVDVLAICTNVDRVYLNFGRPDARGLGRVTAEELRQFAAGGHFPPGTMGPKVEAALRFLAAGGPEVIVTSPDRLVSALTDGREGTHVVSRAHPARAPRLKASADARVD